MNELGTYAINPFGTAGTGFALSSQARSRSAGQWECSPVIGSDA
jgi:hypothetical protein